MIADMTAYEMFWLVLAVIIYFFPAMIAQAHRHHNSSAIAVLNIFLGWTVLGWFAALIWANTSNRRKPTPPELWDIHHGGGA